MCARGVAVPSGLLRARSSHRRGRPRPRPLLRACVRVEVAQAKASGVSVLLSLRLGSSCAGGYIRSERGRLWCACVCAWALRPQATGLLARASPRASSCCCCGQVCARMSDRPAWARERVRVRRCRTPARSTCDGAPQANWHAACAAVRPALRRATDDDHQRGDRPNISHILFIAEANGYFPDLPLLYGDARRREQNLQYDDGMDGMSGLTFFFYLLPPPVCGCGVLRCR